MDNDSTTSEEPKLTLDPVKRLVGNETSRVKTYIALHAGLLLALSLSFGIIYVHRLNSVVVSGRAARAEQPTDLDFRWYDIGCNTNATAEILIFDQLQMRLPISNLTALGFKSSKHIWTNSTEANTLMEDIYNECKEDPDYDDLQDCFRGGAKWSHIYAANAVILLGVAFSSLTTFFGIFLPVIRIVAGCALNLFCFLNFLLFIVTAVYRFNSWGTLCAMNKIPTNWKA